MYTLNKNFPQNSLIVPPLSRLSVLEDIKSLQNFPVSCQFGVFLQNLQPRGSEVASPKWFSLTDYTNSACTSLALEGPTEPGQWVKQPSLPDLGQHSRFLGSPTMTSQCQLAVIIEKITSPAYHLFIIFLKKGCDVRYQVQNKWLFEVPINMSKWALASRFSQHPSVSTYYRAFLIGLPCPLLWTPWLQSKNLIIYKNEYLLLFLNGL